MLEGPLDGRLFGEEQLCFGCGPSHPHGFQLKFERVGDEVETRFTPGDLHQGPLSVMHGGLVMTVADETAAWAVLSKLGKFGFTTTFQGRFVRPVRMGLEHRARARVTKETSRIVRTEVSITQGEELCFQAELAFALLDEAAAAALMQQPIREEWKRFCR